MDNNKNNKRSPLDEIMQLTKEAKGTAKASPKAEVKPVPKAEVKPAPKAEVKPAPKAEVKPAPKAEVKPEPKAEVKPAPKTEVKPAPKAEVKPAPKPEAKPVARPTAKPVPDRTTPVQPKAAAPAPKPTLAEPETTVTDDFDYDIPFLNKFNKGNKKPVATAAETKPAPKPAPKPAVPASDANSKTRVLDLSNTEERQLAEARELVKSNAQRKVTEHRFDADDDTEETKFYVDTEEMAAAKKAKSKKAKDEMGEEFESAVGSSMLSGTIKAIIYIVSVFVVSGLLALVTILMANDCFAFIKSDEEITVTIPKEADLDDVAEALKDSKAIKFPSVFKLYISLRNKDSGEYVAGSHKISGIKSYDMLISAVKPSTSREEISVTLIEGWTTQEIIDHFIANGIGTQEGFTEAINNHDYDYWFLDELNDEKASQRIYKLDGYLFPDTYNFYKSATEVDVITKLLDNFETKFDKENSSRAAELGMSVDDIVIMASMIQKEAMYVTDYPLVSSVFHNRLNSNTTNGKLESNATVQYTMPREEVTVELSYEQIQKYDNAYNTFLYEGMPIGPICNSSLNALNWALYPNDTNFYYFVSDAEGVNHYAETYNEHQKNVNDIEAAKEAAN